MSFDSIKSADSIESNPISDISIMSIENILESENSESEIFDFEVPNPEPINIEFPNEAYKDLMLLVTNHKLNNKAGNEIIRFFNKHSNLTKSPLPKNIEKGRAFMNNMKFSTLEFNKVFMARHNNKDYFLYCQNLINCIKNILAIPDISQDFALSFNNYKVKMLIFKLF